MPCIKGGCKINLVRLTQARDESLGLNTGLEPRVIREIAGDDLLLVEVTHLDGYIGEDLS